MARSQLDIILNFKERGSKKALADLGKTVARMATLAAAAGAAAAKAFDFARQGAELDLTREKFDRLSASIGTTADALSRDLKRATGGLISDAKLMAGAMDLMALGLVDNHDEAVRMARIVGELNMDMNQLVLTMTNMTTMRFDALGVRVEGFEDKVKDLEASGLSAADAFKEAFLEQAEEQIERVGSVADSAIGDYQRLEAQIQNVGDALKDAADKGLTPFVGGLADRLQVIAGLNELLALGAIDVERWEQRVREAKDIGWDQALLLVNQELDQQRRIFAGIDERMQGADHTLSIYAGNLDELPTELLTTLTVNNEQAKEKVSEIKRLLGSINFNILRASGITEEFGTGGSGTGTSGYIDMGQQHGGTFTVPPGFPGDSFPFRVSSGEQVTVSNRDERSFFSNSNVNINNGTGLEAFEEILRSIQ